MGKLKMSKGDKVFIGIVYVFLLLLLVTVVLPLLYVISNSLSSPEAVATGRVGIFPVGFSLDAYKKLLKQDTLIRGFLNTLLYTVSGTFLNVSMTLITAYPLSRKDLVGKKIFIWYFTFTMLFSGGMIPSYLLIQSLGMVNTRWVMIIPGAMAVGNMIITRTFFQTTIPYDLNEAALIDGANDTKIFFSIILPLSTPIIAVLGLFAAVAHWNSYFGAMIYLSDPKLFNIQLLLRNFMSNITALSDSNDSIADASKAAGIAEVMKYAMIVFTSLPVMILYPFLQKYFLKGIMVGSLKG